MDTEVTRFEARLLRRVVALVANAMPVLADQAMAVGLRRGRRVPAAGAVEGVEGARDQHNWTVTGYSVSILDIDNRHTIIHTNDYDFTLSNLTSRISSRLSGTCLKLQVILE